MMPPTLIFLIAAAPFVGSFLGTLILRLPDSQPIVLARSTCSSCGTSLRPHELVPLLSWTLQRGTCRSCGTQISIFYPVIEVAAVAIPVWAATAAEGFALAWSCLLGWGLLALAVMDWRSYCLSDFITLPLAVIGLAATWCLAPDQLMAHVFAGAGVLLFLLSLAHLYRMARGRDGLGMGDVKLFGVGGTWCGWEGFGSILLIASVSALLAVAVMRVLGRPMDSQTRIPYGLFLAFGIWIVWLYGPVSLSR